MASSHRLGNFVITFLWMFVLLELICGCAFLPTPGPSTRSTPLPAVAQTPYRPLIAVQFCEDGPPNFNGSYAEEAAASVADKIDSMVTANQGGVNVFVSLITHDSLPTNMLAFSVPAVAAFPAPPASPVNGDDPYKNAQLRRDYTKSLAAYAKTSQQEKNNLAAIRSQVKQHTDKLRRLTPVYDNQGSDIFGCLYAASQDFSHVQGKKYLVIASAWINNVNLQETSTLNLYSAVVRGIWRSCSIATVCQQDNTYWKNTLLHFGASSVDFFSVAYSEANHLSF